MVALEWSDVDFKRGQLTVRRGQWEGEVVAPKGGRSRVVPMTEALKKALTAIRHLRGDRVFDDERNGGAFERAPRPTRRATSIARSFSSDPRATP